MHPVTGKGAKVMAGFASPRTHAFSVNGTLTIDHDKNVTGAGEISFDGLPDGEHTLTYSTFNASLSPVFDYLVIEAGENTDMKGRTVLVDDMFSQIKYIGNGWKVVDINNISASDVYQTTAHITETVGDSLSMKFRGAVYSWLYVNHLLTWSLPRIFCCTLCCYSSRKKWKYDSSLQRR